MEPFQVKGENIIASNCAINLAAIHPTGGEFSRWANLNGFRSNTENWSYGFTLKSTPKEIAATRSLGVDFYDGTRLIAPTPANQTLNDTPVGLIMTSNNVDLPVLTNYYGSLAKELCELYEVDLLYEINLGLNSKTTVIKEGLKKKLLSRRELLASNHWPEGYDAANIEYLEGVRTNPNDGAVQGYVLNGQQCYLIEQPAQTPTRWQPLRRLLTSTSISPGLDETPGVGARCFSRYGIQHLVGNVEELNSDVLFCDYTQNELRFGMTELDTDTGTWVQSGLASYFSLEHPDLKGMDWIYISKNLKIKNNSGEVVGEFSGSNITPYAFIDQFSGYCSTVDLDLRHRSEKLNNLKYSTFETYKYSFMSKLVKTLNDALIPASRFSPGSEDIEAVASYRDGGGYFLDFGDKHMAQPLRYKNILGFPWKYSGPGGGVNSLVYPSFRAQNVFFSSLMGIPLNCGFGGSLDGFTSECESHLPNLTEKNTYDQSQFFKNEDEQLPLPNVTNFHVGGSRIENIGVTDISSRPHPQGNLNDFHKLSNKSYNVRYISAIKLKRDPPSDTPFALGLSNLDDWEIELVDSKDIPPGTDIEVWQVRWSIPQTWIDSTKKGERLRLYSGGRASKVNSDSSEKMNGRFSLSIQRESPTMNRGIRCAVKINEGN